MTLPAGGGGTDTNDYVDSFVAALSGSDLTLTLGRTGTLADLEQTVTLPAGGGAGGLDRREYPTELRAKHHRHRAHAVRRD